MQKLLHVGCGSADLPSYLSRYAETRLDIDAECDPDVVASMTSMPSLQDGSFDVVFACHSLEHLYPHECGAALAEFYRVLKPGGSAVLFVPDLEDVRPTEDVLYHSGMGPVAGLDLYYGFRAYIAANPHMAHHNGFTERTLRDALLTAGFGRVVTRRAAQDSESPHSLFAVGIRP